ncbi:hypothetical protein HZB02_03335 [Candidatus Woesearchaeota archaeon]|nr:hypothetical protein [Candidatus Woesearchaeota archaeon]
MGRKLLVIPKQANDTQLPAYLIDHIPPENDSNWLDEKLYEAEHPSLADEFSASPRSKRYAIIEGKISYDDLMFSINHSVAASNLPSLELQLIKKTSRFPDAEKVRHSSQHALEQLIAYGEQVDHEVELDMLKTGISKKSVDTLYSLLKKGCNLVHSTRREQLQTVAVQALTYHYTEQSGNDPDAEFLSHLEMLKGNYNPHAFLDRALELMHPNGFVVVPENSVKFWGGGMSPVYQRAESHRLWDLNYPKTLASERKEDKDGILQFYHFLLGRMQETDIVEQVVPRLFVQVYNGK